MPQTMPKNPNWLKKADQPRRQPATLPDYAADLAGPSRQVRRRAAAVLEAQEASTDRAITLAMKKAAVKRRQGERQAAAQRQAAADVVEMAA